MQYKFQNGIDLASSVPFSVCVKTRQLYVELNLLTLKNNENLSTMCTVTPTDFDKFEDTVILSLCHFDLRMS